MLVTADAVRVALASVAARARLERGAARAVLVAATDDVAVALDVPYIVEAVVDRRARDLVQIDDAAERREQAEPVGRAQREEVAAVEPLERRRRAVVDEVAHVFGVLRGEEADAEDLWPRVGVEARGVGEAPLEGRRRRRHDGRAEGVQHRQEDRAKQRERPAKAARLVGPRGRGGGRRAPRRAQVGLGAPLELPWRRRLVAAAVRAVVPPGRPRADEQRVRERAQREGARAA